MSSSRQSNKNPKEKKMSDKMMLKYELFDETGNRIVHSGMTPAKSGYDKLGELLNLYIGGIK